MKEVSGVVADSRKSARRSDAAVNETIIKALREARESGLL